MSEDTVFKDKTFDTVENTRSYLLFVSKSNKTIFSISGKILSFVKFQRFAAIKAIRII